GDACPWQAQQGEERHDGVVLGLDGLQVQDVGPDELRLGNVDPGELDHAFGDLVTGHPDAGLDELARRGQAGARAQVEHVRVRWQQVQQPTNPFLLSLLVGESLVVAVTDPVEGSGLMLGPFGPGRRVRDGHEWVGGRVLDRKSTRLNSSHVSISYAVFCMKY